MSSLLDPTFHQPGNYILEPYGVLMSSATGMFAVCCFANHGQPSSRQYADTRGYFVAAPDDDNTATRRHLQLV